MYKKYRHQLQNPPTGGGKPVPIKAYFGVFDELLADDCRLDGVIQKPIDLGLHRNIIWSIKWCELFALGDGEFEFTYPQRDENTAPLLKHETPCNYTEDELFYMGEMESASVNEITVCGSKENKRVCVF